MGGVPMKFNRDGLPDQLPGWFYTILISFGVRLWHRELVRATKYRSDLTRSTGFCPDSDKVKGDLFKGGSFIEKKHVIELILYSK